jgi:signal transduction histidine kinase
MRSSRPLVRGYGFDALVVLATIGSALFFSIGSLAGFALHERADQAEAAGVRAAQAERERDTATRLAVAEERARIARELHDIVATPSA